MTRDYPAIVTHHASQLPEQTGPRRRPDVVDHPYTRRSGTVGGTGAARVVELPTCQRAFGPDFLAGDFFLLGDLATAAFLLLDFDALLAGVEATDFLGPAFFFEGVFFAVAFLVVGVLAFAFAGDFAAARPGLTLAAFAALAAPDDRLRVLPTTVSVPGPGIRLVSSPDSHRTRSMLPLVDITTPSLGPDLDATDTLSPTSATPLPHLAEGPSIGRGSGVHKPGARHDRSNRRLFPDTHRNLRVASTAAGPNPLASWTFGSPSSERPVKPRPIQRVGLGIEPSVHGTVLVTALRGIGHVNPAFATPASPATSRSDA